MTSIDTRPGSVDIFGYGGDTLPIQVSVNTSVVGATWSGQVRTARGATVDAEFTFVSNATGALATLSAVATDALADLGVAVVENGESFKRYSGVYDIQIVLSGEVTTLVRGKIVVDSDVTQAP